MRTSTSKPLTSMTTITGVLLCLTLLTGAILSAPKVAADASSVIDIEVNVPTACTLTPANTILTKTINPGTSDKIGDASLKAVCNDPSGFAIYTVGYTNDEYGNNALITDLGAEHKIDTGTNEHPTESQWNMTITNTNTTGNYTADINNDFDQPHEVPEVYTKVATVSSITDQTIGTNLNARFDASIASNQPAATYTGKVKFMLVHPASAATPEPPRFMQNVADWGDSVGYEQVVTAIDSRDGKEYMVSRLRDGNLWMIQNLDHDIDPSFRYTSENTDIGWDSDIQAYNDAVWTPSIDASTRATDDVTWVHNNYYVESYDPGDLYWSGSFDVLSGWDYDEYWSTCDNSTPRVCDESLNPMTVVATSSGKQQYHFGNYYNWAAATAGFSATSGTDGQIINQSICPSGWTLPKAGVENDSFYMLLDWYGLAAASVNDTYSIWAEPLWLTPLDIYDGGHSGYVGYYGHYWSSTRKDSNAAYALSFDEFSPNLSAYVSRGYGLSVRCVDRMPTPTD